MSKSDTEDRDQQFLKRLANIENRVDSIDQTQAFALRANSEKHMDSVLEIFGKSDRRVQVYLAANGRRTVGEIAKMFSMTQPAVSRELLRIQKDGLLEVVDKVGSNIYYSKKAVDGTLRITRFLMKEYSFDKNGYPVK